MPKGGDECPPCPGEEKKEVSPPAVDVSAPKVIEAEVKPEEVKVEPPKEEIKADVPPEKDPNKQYIGSGKDRLTINIGDKLKKTKEFVRHCV
mgnify:CR=1 FL=1